MKTYLFIWNEKHWDWKNLPKEDSQKNLEECIDEIEKKGSTEEQWSVASHKKIKRGDRAFLIKIGQEPKGIMAEGRVRSLPFLSKHWSEEDKMVHRVMIDFEVILNPEKEPLLSLDILKKINSTNNAWTPHQSGIEIPEEVTDELEAAWFDHLTIQEIRPNLFKESETDKYKTYIEGTQSQVLVTRYERNPHARKTCLNHYGLSCTVCNFNFEENYGELGKNFIHVHHLRQMSTIGKEYKIDPLEDLRPVCPNCHAMIHKRKELYTIDEIKEMINKNSR